MSIERGNKIEDADKWREPFKTVAGAMAILGGVLMAISTLDSYVDLIPGDNPFSGQEHGSLKHVLKDLKTMPPDGMPWSAMTIPQQITSTGFGIGAFNAIVMQSWKLHKVNVSWTLAALAAYEVAKFFTVGHISLSRLVFFTGATLSMVGTGLYQAVEKPRSIAEQAQDKIDKAKRIIDKVRRKKED